MSWFDNQNNVILLIAIAVIVYFMMQKDNFGPSNGGCTKDKECGSNEKCRGGRCATTVTTIPPGVMNNMNNVMMQAARAANR